MDKRRLILRGRYYRRVPLSAAGYAEETVELKAGETTFAALHCWDTGTCQGESLDDNYCVCMGYQQTIDECARICRQYIRPAMDASRKAGILVTHIETADIVQRHPELLEQFPLLPAKSIPPAEPAVPGHRESIHERNHGRGYLTQSPYMRKDRIKVLMPDPGEPFVCQTEKLDQVLRERGIVNIIYTGFATDICLLTTNGGVEAMAGLGYRLYLMREGTLGYEYPDTFEERISTRWGIRNLEANYGDTIGFDDYMENCRRLKEEKDGG